MITITTSSDDLELRALVKHRPRDEDSHCGPKEVASRYAAQTALGAVPSSLLANACIWATPLVPIRGK